MIIQSIEKRIEIFILQTGDFFSAIEDMLEEEDFEEGEGPTDIPVSMTSSGKVTHMQLDGKINVTQLQEAVDMAKEACKEVYEIQKKALKDVVEKEMGDSK